MPNKKTVVFFTAVFLWCIFLASCASNKIIIQQNGMPIPKELFEAKVFDFTVQYSFARMFEESKESVYPEYFLFEETNRVKDRKTQKIILYLRVVNPKQLNYSLTKVVKINKSTYRQEIYRGDKEDKIFQLEGPLITGRIVTIKAVVYCDKYGLKSAPLFSTENMKYYIKTPRGEPKPKLPREQSIARIPENKDIKKKHGTEKKIPVKDANVPELAKNTNAKTEPEQFSGPTTEKEQGNEKTTVYYYVRRIVGSDVRWQCLCRNPDRSSSIGWIPCERIR